MSENIKDQQDLKLILSSVRALWGEITPSLRSVSTELHDSKIIWQCIFDVNATDDDFELLSSAATEVIADFKDYELEEIIKKVPFPDKMNHLKNLIYLRHEKNYYKE